MQGMTMVHPDKGVAMSFALMGCGKPEAVEEC